MNIFPLDFYKSIFKMLPHFLFCIFIYLMLLHFKEINTEVINYAVGNSIYRKNSDKLQSPDLGSN